MDSHRMMKPPESGNQILHENAFERFNIGTASMRTMVKFIDARKTMEADIAKTMKKFVGDWTKILHDNIDIEYGQLRQMWQDMIYESLETAHIHTLLKNELCRPDGPLESAKAALMMAHPDRTKNLLKFYKETRDKHTFFIDNIARARKIYYDKIRKYQALEDEMNARLFRSKSSPKYLEAKLKLERSEQEVSTCRVQYKKRLLEEQGARLAYMANMQEAKEEFDRVEKHRLRQVKQCFLEVLDVSQMQDKREGRTSTLNELRHKLETLNLDEEVKQYDSLYMTEYQAPRYKEFSNKDNEQPVQPEKEVVEDIADHYSSRSNLYGPATSKDEAVYPVLLPSLQLPPPVIEEPKDDHLWWADIRPNKKTIDPLVEPPPYTLRELANSFIEGKLSTGRNTNTTPVTVSSSDEEMEGEFSPGATKNMQNVRVKAVRAYTGRGPGELSFKIGQTLKQKSVADEVGMAYGWLRKGRTGRKRYGYFPVSLVQLKKPKESMKERIARVVSRNSRRD